MKAMKSFGVVVFVDIQKGNDERRKLPANINKAFSSIKGNSIPYVHITSPDLTQNFGSYGYAALKPQDFRKIFRGAKKKIRDAKKLGALSSADLEESADESSDGRKDSAVVTISSPTYENWETAKGKTIKAMLLSVKNGDTYIFKTEAGKRIEVKPHHLSQASQERIKKLAGEDQG